MPLNTILGLFSLPITIRVSPGLFYFTAGTKSLQLETFLNIKKVGEKYTVHSVGEDASAEPDVLRIDLFRNSEISPGADRMEALVAYLRYAIQKLSRKGRFIRPVITVKNAKSLDGVLMGYQQLLLRTVLAEAGAREVRFEGCHRARS